MTTRSIQVWDLPTRLFHWSLVILVTVSVATANVGGNLMIWHERSGLAIIGLLAFRLAWGFVGSTYARFAHFVRGPGTIAAYLRGQWNGAGHNPLGALSVLAMLTLLTAQALTGLFGNDDIAFNGPLYALVSKAQSNAMTAWHHRGEYALYALVGLHLLAVLYYSVVRRERIVPPMITGKKDVAHDDLVPARGGGPIAFVIALGFAVLAVWLAAGGALSPPPPAAPTPAW